MRRAEAVKEFLVKYGASADQITTAGDGKRASGSRQPHQGRALHEPPRRADGDRRHGQGDQGRRHQRRPERACRTSWKKQEECCAPILKRLDKLDEILAAIKNLQGENDKLRGELDRSAQPAQRAARPGVRPAQAAQRAADRRPSLTPKPWARSTKPQRRNKKFSLVGTEHRTHLRPPAAGAISPSAAAASTSRRSAATARAPCRPRASSCTIRAARKASSTSVW